MASFITSMAKTAVEAKYRGWFGSRWVRLYLISRTNPTICATSRNRAPYLMILLFSVPREPVVALSSGSFLDEGDDLERSDNDDDDEALVLAFRGDDDNDPITDLFLVTVA
jgi:hypothetical protein